MENWVGGGEMENLIELPQRLRSCQTLPQGEHEARRVLTDTAACGEDEINET
jgi:hypothetical protein